MNKRFYYKVYDSNGNFVSTINDVVDEPKFTSYINSGVGSLTIKLPRSIFSFEESTVVAQNNQIKVVCVDNGGENVIYSGYISKYTPTLDQGKEYVTVECLGYITETERFIAEDATGGTTLTYNSFDPSDIFSDILDKFSAAGGRTLAQDIELTGTVVSYEFNTYSVKEVLDKIIELAPMGWYYFFSPNDVLTFKGKDATANHTFTLGKDVISIIPEKSVENVTNRIYFTGGGDPPLYKKYERSGSISSYGLYSKKIIDSRITDETTMDIVAGSILDRDDSPETRTRLIIRDNNAEDGRGYDIESIKPGDTVKILGFDSRDTSKWGVGVWDVSKWDYDISQVSQTVQQIVKVEYSPTYVTLEISSKLPNISKRVEDIKRNLDRVYTDNNPSSPSV